MTLDGVCAALVPSLYASSVYAETRSITTPLVSGSRTILKTARLVGNFAQSFAFTPVDADGNTILTSAGAIPIAVTESGTTPHVTILANATGAANTVFKVTPIVAEPDGVSTQLTASSPNCGSGTATLPNSFALSTSAEVFVADYYAGVLAFDQDGTQLAKISSMAPGGLAYNSKSNYLVAVGYGGSSSGLIAFQTLSLTGSLLGSGSFTPSQTTCTVACGPYNLAYNPINGFFTVLLSSGHDGHGNETVPSIQCRNFRIHCDVRVFEV